MRTEQHTGTWRRPLVTGRSTGSLGRAPAKPGSLPTIPIEVALGSWRSPPAPPAPAGSARAVIRWPGAAGVAGAADTCYTNPFLSWHVGIGEGGNPVRIWDRPPMRRGHAPPIRMAPRLDPPASRSCVLEGIRGLRHAPASLTNPAELQTTGLSKTGTLLSRLSYARCFLPGTLSADHSLS